MKNLQIYVGRHVRMQNLWVSSKEDEIFCRFLLGGLWNSNSCRFSPKAHEK